MCPAQLVTCLPRQNEVKAGRATCHAVRSRRSCTQTEALRVGGSQTKADCRATRHRFMRGSTSSFRHTQGRLRLGGARKHLWATTKRCCGEERRQIELGGHVCRPALMQEYNVRKTQFAV